MGKFLSYLLLFMMLFTLLMLVFMGSGNSLDNRSDLLVEDAGRNFSDSVRREGYISPTEYNKFISYLGSIGVKFTVELEHTKKNYEPIYTDPTSFATFTGEYTTYTESFYTSDILDVVFPDNGIEVDDTSRYYEMNKGDFFSVRIIVEPSASEFLKESTYGIKATKRVFPYGGLVRDES